MAEELQQNSQGQEGFKLEENAPINVKVVSSTGDEVFFKIKSNTKLSKLQGAYATKVGKDVGSIRFLYDGSRINDDDTPASLEMEDNDTIDVMVEQVGGSSPAYLYSGHP
ncbi:ubiquitin-related domain-containing protein [Suillus bovinus]|uniref:ubiquitin-related domain-containing protein n=1 Tax=Suillus bovinus TaxID=48563 RepID=UPI001B86B1EA|nr:ubiquitin-related domain-containing protein [Suillus bovinus]KAG2144362.1 ubiquitin-related domain-containing protein [Suillus bovinus]